MSRKWKDMAWLTWWVIVIGFVLSFGVSDMHAADGKAKIQVAITYGGSQTHVRSFLESEDKGDLLRIIQQERVWSVTFYALDKEYPVLNSLTYSFHQLRVIFCTEGIIHFVVDDETTIKVGLYGT